MNMMHTMASQEIAAMPKRRFYEPQLKRQIVAEAQAPGASVAGVALAHGINANIVHRWIREQAGLGSAAPQGFMALSIQASAPAAASADGGKTGIRIELRRGATLVSIAWPAAQAGECAVWMRELLR
jgi:transposase